MYQLCCGDCLKFMGQMESGSVDCVIADLPYGTIAASWDTVIDLAQFWEHMRRILSPLGTVLVFGTQPYLSDHLPHARDLFRDELVWEKTLAPNFINAKNRHMRIHENIWVFSKGVTANNCDNQMTYNPQMQAGKPYKRFGSVESHSWQIIEMRASHKDNLHINTGTRYPKTILKYSNSDHSNILHPTQKPLDLCQYLIRTFSNEGETIFDPTMGSGSTGVAAILEGRRFIGCELDEGYYNLAEGRIHEAETMEKVVTIGTEVAKQTTIFEVSDKSIEVSLRNVKTN